MKVEKDGIFFDIDDAFAKVYFRNGYKEVTEEPKEEPKAKRGRPKKK